MIFLVVNIIFVRFLIIHINKNRIVLSFKSASDTKKILCNQSNINNTQKSICSTPGVAT